MTAQIRSLLLASTLLIAGVAIVGCGKQADLEQPRPLFGKPYQPKASELRRDQSAARAIADAAARADPRAPQSVEEVRGQGIRPRHSAVSADGLPVAGPLTGKAPPADASPSSAPGPQ